jgi:hypothetical protein
MPAENIMANHDTVENSGRSPSRPSGMLPYLPAASHRTKNTKPVAASANSQPVLSTTHSRPTLDACPSVSGDRMPQATKAMDSAAVTPNTTRSRDPGRSLRNASAGGSNAGWTASSTRSLPGHAGDAGARRRGEQVAAAGGRLVMIPGRSAGE